MAVISDTVALTQRLKSCSSREEMAIISPWKPLTVGANTTQRGRDSALASVSGLSSLCKHISHSVPAFSPMVQHSYVENMCVRVRGAVPSLQHLGPLTLLVQLLNLSAPWDCLTLSVKLNKGPPLPSASLLVGLPHAWPEDRLAVSAAALFMKAQAQEAPSDYGGQADQTKQACLHHLSQAYRVETA